MRVADCAFNVERHLALMEQAQKAHVAVLLFPEMSLTGYTCADLFQQLSLLNGARRALLDLVKHGRPIFDGVIVVGLPLALDDQVFNCAAVIYRGRILGLVPKSFIPNYKEFYEGRWFAAAATARSDNVYLDGAPIPFGTDLLFDATDAEGVILGVEICEDLWVPVPPSSYQAVAGATLLLNPSASNEIIGKAGYRRQLVVNQSGRCMSAYLYASCGVWESTTDVVFGGHCMIAENGSLLLESDRLRRQETLLIVDVDVDRLRADRMRTNSFGDAALYANIGREYRRVGFEFGGADAIGPKQGLRRSIDAHPFVPKGTEQLRERCEEIFQTQVTGLAKRLEHIGKPPVTIGISGGLDSTLALLVACKTLDHLSVPRSQIRAFTLPGFGTTSKTRDNATQLMQHLGVTARKIDIRQLCLDEMKHLEHQPFGIDLDGMDVERLMKAFHDIPKEKCQDVIFENIQARMRTSLLMNSGFVIGTGDVSELALGWCTYNADHMSMYNPNVSIPKTLVKFLVAWAARAEFEGPARETLLSIVGTPISPELLPVGKDGEIVQTTEDLVGPYELHDFFLFHLLRYGAPPEKILFLAEQAKFDVGYSTDVIRKWLRTFIWRFFNNQFKRSCLPDGPKVGSISLSPRGDWRMPSDGQPGLWLEWANQGP